MPIGETIVGPATVVGQSALGIIRLSGSLCVEIMRGCFGSEVVSPRLARFGRYRGVSGVVIDEVIYTYFSGDSSYTGEDLLEISCHGNPLIVSTIISDLLRRGCRMAEGGEFTKTAYLNGKMDLSQAEAVCDVITAKSERGLYIAQRQLSGALGEKIGDFTDELLQIMAEVEAYIDFPEDDLPEEDKSRLLGKMDELIGKFSVLIETNRYKELLQDGVKAVIIGAPNAGKSSLLNALLGEERALVSPEAGTTRDFIAERIMIGPYAIRLMDTAGLRESMNSIERAGIDKTEKLLFSADLRILVVDGSVPYPIFSDKIFENLDCNNTLILENKSDLGGGGLRPGVFEGFKVLSISIKTGEGMAGLRSEIEGFLRENVIEEGEEELIISERHANALREAGRYLGDGKLKMMEGVGGELVSMDLRFALDALGGVVGKVDNERMLDKLFSTFCIGK